MIDEPFTTPLKYEVKVKHPFLGSVTVRSAAATNAPEIGRLRTGDTLTCTLDFMDGGIIWATIVDFEREPTYQYGYFALAYPSLLGKIKEFGTYELAEGAPAEDPVELPRHYVLPDWESPLRGFKVRSTAKPGTPAIQPVSSTENNWKQTDFARWPKRWQLFAKDLLCMQKFGRNYPQLSKADKAYIDSKFKDLYAGNKAFTNTHGIETNDPRFESLITCGNYVYEVTRIQSTAGKMKGKWMVMLYSFDINDEPPVVTKDTLKDPRVQFAKIVNQPKQGAPKGYLTNFPHLGGLEVPVPFLTNGRRWYPLEELREA
jgi:hypothetical protein